MPAPRDHHPDLAPLVAPMFEEELSDEQWTRLCDLLRHDPAARRAYLRLRALHAQLTTRHSHQTLRGEAPLPSTSLRAGSIGVNEPSASPHADAEPAPGRSVWYTKGFRGQGSGFIFKAAIAALIMLAATLLYVFVPFTPHSALPAPHSAAPASYAMLSDMSPDAIFADGERSLGEGLNTPIRLTAGRAQVMFESTAVVDLTGPCEFEMTGPNRARLEAGQMEAYCRPQARGFTIDLPGSVRIVDRGTRFALDVPGGATARTMTMVVRQGHVDASVGDATPLNFAAGECLVALRAGAKAPGELHRARAAIHLRSGAKTTARAENRYTVGSLIQVGDAPLWLTHLGVQDAGPAGPANDGFFSADPIDVGLWDATGAQLIAHVRIPSSALSIDGWRYVPIDAGPIRLEAGQRYRIGANVGAGIEWFLDGGGAAAFEADDAVRLVESCYRSGAFGAPLQSDRANAARWGAANALFIPIRESVSETSKSGAGRRATENLRNPATSQETQP
ncbi:MAG: hypothetical protein GC162_07260 [Planctomycetes bacterium]|nr:hypothetical protein [Planctomycetota bacterium]